jgi:ABC-type glucose/galactose transport system permease subunit
MPFTSTLAMLLILYIIKAYLFSFVPALLAVAREPKISKFFDKGVTQIYIETAVFIFLSFSCLYILVLKLWCKCLPLAADPGHISEKLEDQIFKENNI